MSGSIQAKSGSAVENGKSLNPALKVAPSGRWDAPSSRPLAARYTARRQVPHAGDPNVRGI